jgi:Peptidase A4 family
VPTLTSGATCSEELSQWVGIDGFSNSDLIQAGVGESMVGPYDNQTCTTGHYYIWAWWEVLPASMSPISMTVQAGDSVTVDISQIGTGNWDIKITDNTENETFNQDETYSAPLSSAEWVVEAPFDHYVCSGYCAPDPYSPAVPFTAIGYTGATSAAYDIVMTQDISGTEVNLSTPNRLSAWPSGFSISYTGGGVAGPRASALATSAVAAGKGLTHPIFQG